MSGVKITNSNHITAKDKLKEESNGQTEDKHQ